jgi:hypothetical protein
MICPKPRTGDDPDGLEGQVLSGNCSIDFVAIP